MFLPQEFFSSENLFIAVRKKIVPRKKYCDKNKNIL